jgi:ubiquinone/menaquinone biosynthesis C-methylase UbiE
MSLLDTNPGRDMLDGGDESPLPTLKTDLRRRHRGKKTRQIDYQGEEEFHDEWGRSVDPADVPVVPSFEACTAPENRFIIDWLGDVRGLRVLDLGCGAGEAGVYFATRGAKVTACDLSTGMLELTRRVARRHNTFVHCVRQNAGDLQFPDDSYDVVYAGNLLHHADIERTLASITRVLKPAGRFVSWDPLRHNPIINIYRRMAGSVRTKDEQPLSIKQLDLFRSRFQTVEHRCFWLTTQWIFMKFFLLERVHPKEARYWKKIILEADRLEPTYRRLAAVDRLLLKLCPWLGRMCWNMVICSEGPIKVIKKSDPRVGLAERLLSFPAESIRRRRPMIPLPG